MKSLEFLTKVPTAKKDNFNRDSSACRSRAGYVIHSGVHRSTAFVSRLDAIESLEYWQEQGGLNPWVEGTIEGLNLEDCELNSLARLHPDWNFSRVESCGAVYCLAVKKSGGFYTRIGGRDWRELHEKID